ncbi:hypothetical protein JW872_03285 [Candidatus Babeliales bacterium]|nr:hypothetical protein [Candidatus Babeliales bacterium]
MTTRLITCCTLLFAGTICAEEIADNRIPCPPKPTTTEASPSIWEQVSSVDYVGSAKNSWTYFQEKIWPMMAEYMLFLDKLNPDAVKILLCASIFNVAPYAFNGFIPRTIARGVIATAAVAHLTRLIHHLGYDRHIRTALTS